MQECAAIDRSKRIFADEHVFVSLVNIILDPIIVVVLLLLLTKRQRQRVMGNFYDT